MSSPSKRPDADKRAACARRWWMAAACVWAVLLDLGCGRIGYQRRSFDAGTGGLPDAAARDGGPGSLDGGPGSLDGGPGSRDGGPGSLDGGPSCEVGTLAFLESPAMAYVYTPIAPAVQVEARGTDGLRLEGCSIAITLELTTGSGGARLLGGTPTQNATSGLATFSDLTIAELGRGMRLRASASGTSPVQSAPFDVTLFDDFEDGVLNAELWSTWQDPPAFGAERSGSFEVAPLPGTSVEQYDGLQSAPVDFTGQRASARIVRTLTMSAGAYENDTEFGIDCDAGHIGWYAEAGELSSYVTIDGTPDARSMPYDPAQHRYWAVRHDASDDSVHWETSIDGTTWTEWRVEPRPFAIDVGTVWLGAGTYVSMVAPGIAAFDDVRVAPAP